jgi:uncharacterized GH25 family protein
MSKTAAVGVAICLVLSILATAAKTPEQYADLSFTVLSEENDRPVRNAAIVLHELDKQGRQASQGVELKTDSEGKSAFAGTRYGKLRIQVIGKGFQTFGQDFVIREPKQEFTIKLKRPVRQYSIYDK